MPETRSATTSDSLVSLSASYSKLISRQQTLVELMQNQTAAIQCQAEEYARNSAAFERMIEMLEKLQLPRADEQTTEVQPQLLPTPTPPPIKSVNETTTTPDSPLLATPTGQALSESSGSIIPHAGQPLQLQDDISYEPNSGANNRVPRVEVPNLFATDFSLILVLNDAEISAESFEIRLCVANTVSDSYRLPVCQNASMGCSSYYIMCANTGGYILAPAVKGDDLSVLLRDMNNFYKVTSSLPCRLRPWKGIKGVQRCRYVKFVDGNYVYDKGRSDMYDNEWYGAVVKENMKVKRGAVTYNSLLAALSKCELLSYSLPNRKPSLLPSENVFKIEGYMKERKMSDIVSCLKDELYPEDVRNLKPKLHLLVALISLCATERSLSSEVLVRCDRVMPISELVDADTENVISKATSEHFHINGSIVDVSHELKFCSSIFSPGSKSVAMETSDFCIKGVQQYAPEILIHTLLPPAKPPDDFFLDSELLSDKFRAAGLTTVTPTHFVVPNIDGRDGDHSVRYEAYRPSLAVVTNDLKYDYKSMQGYVRFSAKEIIGRVTTGTCASASTKNILKLYSWSGALSFVSQIYKSVLAEMKRNEIFPNVVTYSSLINGLCQGGEFEKVKDVLCEMKGCGILPNLCEMKDLITELLGTPPAGTVSGLRNDKARKYLQAMRRKQPVSFTQKFPIADPLAVQLLERMLAFDPKDRITAEHALAHPYFKGLAKIEKEPSCQPISKLEFFERRMITKDDVRELIFRDILEYHPNLLKDYLSGARRKLGMIALDASGMQIPLCKMKEIGITQRNDKKEVIEGASFCSSFFPTFDLDDHITVKHLSVRNSHPFHLTINVLKVTAFLRLCIEFYRWMLAPLVKDMASVTHLWDHAHFIITNTYQEIAQVGDSHQSFTLTRPYCGIHDIDAFDTVVTIVSPGVDMAIYFSYNDDYKRLTTRHKSIEVVIDSSLSDGMLDWVKNLMKLLFETAFLNLGFSLSLDDRAILVRYITKFIMFSLSRPPEVGDLEDKVDFMQDGRNVTYWNIMELEGCHCN